MDPAQKFFLLQCSLFNFLDCCDTFTMSMCYMYNQSQHSFVILEQTKDVASKDILRIITCVYEPETWMCTVIKLFPKSLKSHRVFTKTNQSTNETNQKY